MIRLAALIMFAVLAVTSPAFARDELDSAKDSGLVGERMDGYLGIVAKNPPADIKSLVQDINAKRKRAYEEIATEQGQPLHVVEKLMVEKLVKRAAPGHYIMTEDGRWVKKQ